VRDKLAYSELKLPHVRLVFIEAPTLPYPALCEDVAPAAAIEALVKALEKGLLQGACAVKRDDVASAERTRQPTFERKEHVIGAHRPTHTLGSHAPPRKQHRPQTRVVHHTHVVAHAQKPASLGPPPHMFHEVFLGCHIDGSSKLGVVMLGFGWGLGA